MIKVHAFPSDYFVIFDFFFHISMINHIGTDYCEKLRTMYKFKYSFERNCIHATQILYSRTGNTLKSATRRQRGNQSLVRSSKATASDWLTTLD